MIRAFVIAALSVLFTQGAHAEGRDFVMNLDLKTTRPDGSIGYSINQRGLRLVADEVYAGQRLGNLGYFLTLSGVDSGRGVLTIEFYEHASRDPASGVIAEIVSTIAFELARPTVFEAQAETFGVDLAVSISPR